MRFLSGTAAYLLLCLASTDLIRTRWGRTQIATRTYVVWRSIVKINEPATPSTNVMIDFSMIPLEHRATALCRRASNEMNDRIARGMHVFRQIDPDTAEKLMDMTHAISPELGEFTIAFGYGDVMSRPGLDLHTRELLNIAMLGAMGTAPYQLEMHIKGALNVGVARKEIVEVILQLAAFAGFPAAYNAFMAAKKIFGDNHEPAQSAAHR